MTETEKLCKLLKENDIDFKEVNPETTLWTHVDDECDGDEYVAWEGEGRLYVEQPIKFMTAQRALDVTIGPNGDTSDGWHTFNELYEHRTGLLMAFCNVACAITRYEGYSDDVIADAAMFKSRRHNDGTMFDGMFIVGVNCGGDGYKWATWHCDGKWWDKFDIPEVEKAPEWDGHTPEDALERLVDAFGSIDWGNSGD